MISHVSTATVNAVVKPLPETAFDLAAIRTTSGDDLDIEFHGETANAEADPSNPAAQFLRAGQPLPKELLAYRPSGKGASPGTPTSELAVRVEDLPSNVRRLAAVHITPTDYYCQATLPGRLEELGVRQIALDPPPGLMDPSFLVELGTVLRSVDAFFPSEEETLAFFRPRRPDLWECAAAFSAMGPSWVVIKRGPQGVLVWDGVTEGRWSIPAYPATVRDPFGAGDAFAGGFLAGLALTGDPVEAALRGSISASLAVEGTGALYLLGAAPGLAEARLESLRRTVRRT